MVVQPLRFFPLATGVNTVLDEFVAEIKAEVLERRHQYYTSVNNRKTSPCFPDDNILKKLLLRHYVRTDFGAILRRIGDSCVCVVELQ